MLFSMSSSSTATIAYSGLEFPPKVPERLHHLKELKATKPQPSPWTSPPRLRFSVTRVELEEGGVFKTLRLNATLPLQAALGWPSGLLSMRALQDQEQLGISQDPVTLSSAP